jgi:predicted transcriptional regulator
MTLTVELSPELERRLSEEAAQRGQAPADFARAVLEDRLMERNRAAMALLDQWLAEAPDTEDEVWPEFQAALEADHPSSRKLFSVGS